MQITTVTDKQSAIRYCKEHNANANGMPGIKYKYRKTRKPRDGPQPGDLRDIPEACRTCAYSDSDPECEECRECGEYDGYTKRKEA
jgi:hypothetical protein